MDGLLWLLVTAWAGFHIYAGVMAWWPETPVDKETLEWWAWLEKQRVHEEQMGRRPKLKKAWQRRGR